MDRSKWVKTNLKDDEEEDEDEEGEEEEENQYRWMTCSRWCSIGPVAPRRPPSRVSVDW